jgi:hypothetical protein
VEQILACFIHQKYESVSSSGRASFRAGRQSMRARHALVRRQKGTKKCFANMPVNSGVYGTDTTLNATCASPASS